MSKIVFYLEISKFYLGILIFLCIVAIYQPCTASEVGIKLSKISKNDYNNNSYHFNDLSLLNIDSIKIDSRVDSTNKNEILIKDSTNTLINSFSNSAKDTTQKIDTTIYKALKFHGKLMNEANTASLNISKRESRFIEYISSFDIIKKSDYTTYPINLGFNGQNNQLFFAGNYASGNSFSFNGRNISDPAYSNVNMNMFSPELAENFEILRGSDAILLQSNSSGYGLNYSEIIHNSAKPYTRMWYAQGGGDFIAADGSFSQNISRNTNFTFGFKKMSGRGTYPNTYVDSWNIRLMLRYNLSESTNLTFSEIFTNHSNGTSGGVKDDDEFSLDPLQSFALLSSANERVVRHDFTSTLTHLLNKDTSIIFKSSFYFSNIRNDRFVAAEYRDTLDSISIKKWYTNYVGLTSILEGDLIEGSNILAGADLNYLSLEKNYYFSEFNTLNFAIYGRFEQEVTNSAKIKIGARYNHYLEQNSLASGGGVEIKLTQNSKFWSDVSIFERIPSLFERPAKKEQHFLILGGWDYKSDETIFSSSLYFRSITDRIIANAIFSKDSLKSVVATNDNITISGLAVNFKKTFFKNLLFEKDKLDFQVSAQSNFILQNDQKDLPLYFINLEASYSAIAGRSKITLGVNAKIIDKFKGMIYYPVSGLYYHSQKESGVQSNGLDFFARAILGDAVVKLTFENLLNTRYYYTPFYPQLGRNFRLTVDWSFFD